MLKIRSLNVAYGGLKALSDVSLDVEEGQFVAVVGPNGAGKTTLFKTISGVVTPIAGEITYNGRNLLHRPARRAGKARHRPRARRPPGLRLHDGHGKPGDGCLCAAGAARAGRTCCRSIIELFPILAERRDQLAGTLSGGEQQMLAIGRGLASAPDLLMLDEPSMGLAPTISRCDFRSHRIHPPHPRSDHTAGRAARRRSTRVMRPRLCAGNRAHRSCKGRTIR